MTKTTSKSANVYITLTGGRIDLGSIRADLGRLPIALFQAYEKEAATNPPNPYRYAEQARLIMGIESFLVSATEAASILRSGAGVIYRDCFYRLLIQKIELERSEAEISKKRFRAKCIANLRYNPARILFDRFLDGWPTKEQFAHAAGLSASSINRIFESLLITEENVSITLKSLVKAFEKLGVVPFDFGVSNTTVDESSETQVFRLELQSASLRDRHLRVYIALATRIWYGTNATEEVREKLSRRILSWGLQLVYGADVSSLNRMTDQIFSELVNPPVVVFVETDQTTSVYMGQRENSIPVITLPEELREELTKEVTVR